MNTSKFKAVADTHLGAINKKSGPGLVGTPFRNTSHTAHRINTHVIKDYITADERRDEWTRQYRFSHENNRAIMCGYDQKLIDEALVSQTPHGLRKPANPWGD